MSDLKICRVSVAMIGARMHYAVPRILNDAGILNRFYTDAYLGNKQFLPVALRALPSFMQRGAVKRWLGRDEPGLPPDKVTSFDSLGYWFVFNRSRASTRDQTESIDVRMAQRFNEKIRRTGLGAPTHVYGFNGAALEFFESAKRSGSICILEQTILGKKQERALLTEELVRWPGMEPGLQISAEESIIEMREAKEWELADVIVTASGFVRDGLIADGVEASKIHVVPYGVNPENFQGAMSTDVSKTQARPLRVLFAGQVGLRKGAIDLIRALEEFSPVEIEARMAGRVMLDTALVKKKPANLSFLGHVPRSQMQDLFEWADIFVLPSIVEGSATATYEALMMGLPVITTRNAGSLVRDAFNGFIVPIRDSESLAKAITSYQDRQLLVEHSANAIASRDQVSLRRYKEDLLSVFREMPHREASAGV